MSGNADTRTDDVQDDVDDTQPQAGNDDVQDDVDDTTNDSLSPDDATKLRSELKRVRAEAAKYRTAAKKAEDADLSERQKLERDKTALEARVAQLETSLRDKTVQTIASKVGVKTDLADTISPLLDWDEIDADDPKAIERAIKELVKDRPSLSGRPDGLDGGAGRGSGRSGAGNEPTLTDLLVGAVNRR